MTRTSVAPKEAECCTAARKTTTRRGYKRGYLLSLGLLLGACGAVSEEVDASVCLSGRRWIADDSGDPEMMPGHACIHCHSREDGPRFSAAGTVFASLDQADQCFGLAGVTVTLVGADGATHTAVSNGAGNFSINGALVAPYTAKITFDGEEHVMQTAQTDGDCNTCHTSSGAQGAPGRITP